MNQKKLGTQDNNNLKNLSVHEIILNLNKNSTNSNGNLQDNKVGSENKNPIVDIEGVEKKKNEKSQKNISNNEIHLDNLKNIPNPHNPLKKK